MLVIQNIRELATCGPAGVITNATVSIPGEKILYAGDGKINPHEDDRKINASDLIAIPGFVDCHTHAVYAGSRAKEYEMKIGGASYSEIQNAGGGIHSTVKNTRDKTPRELYTLAKPRLREMLRLGTTTVEIKSGYGLSLKSETNILRAIKRLRQSAKQDIIATFLAHVVPKESEKDRTEYIKFLFREVLVNVFDKKLADGFDVFCDPLGLTPEEAGKLFWLAKNVCGVPLHIHGEQTAHFGGAKLAAKYRTLSLDHGDFLDDEDIAALKKVGTTVVLLPGTILHLTEWNKVDYPALYRKLKAAEVPVALATDFNPGSSPIMSMKVVMDLAIRFFKMSYKEALSAATIGSARALGLEKKLGSIETGKQADLLLIEADSIEDYLHGIGDRKITYIVKKGKIVRCS